MKPAIGAMVFDAGDPARILGKWNGEALVPLSQRADADPSLEDSREQQTSWLFWLFLINTLVGAGLLIVVAFRKVASE